MSTKKEPEPVSIEIDDYYAERRLKDKENEIIVFEKGYPRSFPGGWPSESRWFCKVTKDGLTVEDWATKKGAALRGARRAWKKIHNQKWVEQYGYPRVVTDDRAEH